MAVDLCSWRGYANKSGTLVNTTDYITVNNSLSGSATIFSDGRYTADVEGVPFSNISFKICGVSVIQGQQNFTCPVTTLNTLNLSITLLSSGASCSYSCGCSGGYCCSGATEYITGSGTGTCQSSACAAATTTTTSSGGGGGSAGTTTTTTTTTITTPPVQETGVVRNISANQTAIIDINKSDELKIEEISIEVNNNVNNVQITVKETTQPSSANLVIGSADGSVYKYLEISKTNIQDADISKVKIKFKVEKSWLTANNIDKNTVALSRLVGTSWVKLPTTITSEDATYVYFEAESPGLSVFAISGQKLAVTTQTTTTTTSPTTSTTTTAPPQPPTIPTVYIGVIFLVAVIIVIFYVMRKSVKFKKVVS
ncbi:MAG: PGF-pre-PGF domain-containing protein [Candidatus Aenigmatarchaeota archaeon]